MSQLDKALELCVELGKVLSQTEEYKKMKQVEFDMLHDSEARGMMENLQALQVEMKKKQFTGMVLTEEDNKNLKDLEEETSKNPVVKASLKANADFQGLMLKVSAMIREGIRLNEPK